MAIYYPWYLAGIDYSRSTFHQELEITAIANRRLYQMPADARLLRLNENKNTRPEKENMFLEYKI